MYDTLHLHYAKAFEDAKQEFEQAKAAEGSYVGTLNAAVVRHANLSAELTKNLGKFTQAKDALEQIEQSRSSMAAIVHKTQANLNAVRRRIIDLGEAIESEDIQISQKKDGLSAAQKQMKKQSQVLKMHRKELKEILNEKTLATKAVSSAAHQVNVSVIQEQKLAAELHKQELALAGTNQSKALLLLLAFRLKAKNVTLTRELSEQTELQKAASQQIAHTQSKLNKMKEELKRLDDEARMGRTVMRKYHTRNEKLKHTLSKAELMVHELKHQIATNHLAAHGVFMKVHKDGKKYIKQGQAVVNETLVLDGNKKLLHILNDKKTHLTEKHQMLLKQLENSGFAVHDALTQVKRYQRLRQRTVDKIKTAKQQTELSTSILNAKELQLKRRNNAIDMMQKEYLHAVKALAHLKARLASRAQLKDAEHSLKNKKVQLDAEQEALVRLESALRTSRSALDATRPEIHKFNQFHTKASGKLLESQEALSQNVQEIASLHASVMQKVKEVRSASKYLALASNNSHHFIQAACRTNNSATDPAWHARQCSLKGCDGKAGSNAVADACGVCGGDGSTCKDCAGVPAGGAKLRSFCVTTECSTSTQGCAELNVMLFQKAASTWNASETTPCGKGLTFTRCCRQECY